MFAYSGSPTPVPAARPRGVHVGQRWQRISGRRLGKIATIVAADDHGVALAHVSPGRRTPTVTRASYAHLLGRYVLVAS